jgi:diguanylate cyclase (GGDEF)-like protein
MRDSLRTSGSLEELKRNIIFKITTIKQYMDEKSDEDATRLLEARSEIDRLKMNLTTVSGEIVEMRKKAQSLEEEIMIDPLTGIHNRRACDPLLSEEMRLYRVYRHIFSVVLIDIDHFKRINDTYGHVVGDRCLNELARRMKQNIRKMDFLCRFGGEEFLLLLSGTREERAAQTAEKLRKVVESTLFMYQDHGIRITISAGVGQPNPADETPEALLKRVDSALYHAKGTGRNRVVRWSSIADQQNGRQDNASG